MIASAWSDYSLDVVPLDAPKVQRQECRRAFYAGAKAVLEECLRIADSEDMSEEAAGESLCAMWLEVNKFKLDVLRGEA